MVIGQYRSDLLCCCQSQIDRYEKETLAKELGGGITVNAVAPGFVDTDMVKSVMVKSVPDEVMKSIISKIPLGRLGKALEIAGAVAYLASEDGDYIRGQIIDINGDFTFEMYFSP